MKEIYLAEDTPEDTLLATAVLEKLGECHVTCFTDGLALFRSVHRKPPDLILVDIIMPTLSGLAVTRLLKYDRRFEKLPVIVASSVFERDVRAQALALGADAFLHKPYDPQELMTEVDRMLRRNAPD